MTVEYLDRPGGRVAYEVRGAVPLVVRSPGPGDLRRTFDALAVLPVAAGHRVALLKLRGLGDSSTGRPSCHETDIADDLATVLVGPAMLVGNSHSAGEAALPEVACPTPIAMGDMDPDFTDPEAEARFAAAALGGPTSVLMVPGVGHHPHVEQPERVIAPVPAFFEQLDGWACRE